ncbi:MAG: twin-arginine translocase TatA/TatE family subunit [Anaerolineae bacterium]|nr:twin-arginine translocase TatA/TatE family subunit [Anaerolineae bacterium]
MEIFGVGPAEMLLIFVIALIVFGPGRLPEIGAAIGRAVNDFRKASRELTADLQGSVAELSSDLTQPLSDIQASLTDVTKTAQAEAQAVQREARALSAEITAQPKAQPAKTEKAPTPSSPLDEAEENWLRLGSAIDDEGTSAG